MKLSIYLSIYLSLWVFFYLLICLSVNDLSVYLSVYLHVWKRSYSTRLPVFLNLTTSKTQQFCKTSSIFELDNVKNEAILRDFLIFQSWQHQKRSHSARLPSKMESWVQSWRPRTIALAIFPLHLSKALRLPRKSDARSYEVLHLSHKIISANLKIWGSKMQPFSWNQHPDLLTSLVNMSPVLRLSRKMHLCWASSNVPARFAHFWQGAQSLAPATRNDTWTSKSGANP